MCLVEVCVFVNDNLEQIALWAAGPDWIVGTSLGRKISQHRASRPRGSAQIGCCCSNSGTANEGTIKFFIPT